MKFHVTREREGVTCPEFMDKHLEKECPHRNPCGPLSPQGTLNTTTYARSMVMLLTNSFLIPSVTIAQGWPNPILTCYPQVFALHTPPPSQAQKRDYGARSIVRALAPTLVLLPHKLICSHNYHPPNVGRYSNQSHHPTMLVEEVELIQNPSRKGGANRWLCGWCTRRFITYVLYLCKIAIYTT